MKQIEPETRDRYRETRREKSVSEIKMRPTPNERAEGETEEELVVVFMLIAG